MPVITAHVGLVTLCAPAQLALGLGARVIGTAGPDNVELLRALGIDAIDYRDGLEDRLKDAAPGGIQAAYSTRGQDEIEMLLRLGVPADRINSIAAGGEVAERFGVHTSGEAAAGRGDLAWLGKAIAYGHVYVPIGGVFLALVIGYGLMEFVGVYLRPAMRPIWRVPGRAAVDAVASFVGSYALGLLLTNRMYTGGRYTAREAAIIAVGFSTVSATFMVIVAKTLGLMDIWLWYFFGTLLVTFAVTAITVRIPPLSRIPDECYPGVTHSPEQAVTRDRFRVARRAAEQTLAEAPSLPKNIWVNFRDGLVMVLQILPSIMSVGLIALVLATYTPVFEWIGVIFYPLFWALGYSDPGLLASASATSIAEMFIPATMAAGHEDLVARFVIGVVCVSAIIFFSAVVPAILATDIPVKMWHLLVIWVERVALTIVLATPLAHLVAALT